MAFNINLSTLNAFFWTVTFEDIELRLKLHIEERQVTFQQGYELMILIAKGILGSSSNEGDVNATIADKIKSLPTFNSIDQVKTWFQGNKSNG